MNMFTEYKSLKKIDHKITVADGKQVNVTSIGNINLTNGIVLKDVLYVPQFKFNLISIHKLCSDLACVVSFTLTNCVIQDRLMTRSWSLGKAKQGLYYLDDDSIQKSEAQEFTT